MAAETSVFELVNKFSSLEDKRVASGAIASKLLDLRHSGALQVSSMAEKAPDGNGDRVKMAIDRLAALANNLYEETKSLPADQKMGTLRAREPSVIEQVKTLHDLGKSLHERKEHYYSRIAEASEN